MINKINTGYQPVNDGKIPAKPTTGSDAYNAPTQKKILYICDRKKCGPNHDCFECNHTADVTHAVNFKRDILNDLYVENDNVSHWILTMAVNGHGVYQCKKCRQGGRKFFKFCPNCGSKMIT